MPHYLLAPHDARSSYFPTAPYYDDFYRLFLVENPAHKQQDYFEFPRLNRRSERLWHLLFQEIQMDRTAETRTVQGMIQSFNQQMSQASGLASVAAHLAQNGNVEAATKLILDAEDSVLRAHQLIEAITLIWREFLQSNGD